MDTLCLKSGIHGITSPISVGGALEVRTNSTQQQVSAALGKSTGIASPQKTASFFSFRHPLKSFWPGSGSGNNKRYQGIALEDAVLSENGDKVVVVEEAGGGNETTMRKTTSYTDGQNGNWVLKILHVRSLWKDIAEAKEEDVAVNGQTNDNHEEDEYENEEECEACRINDDNDEIEFDRDSFSRLLRKVSLAEAKL